MQRIKRQVVGSYTFTQATLDDDGSPVTATGPFSASIVDGDGLEVLTPTVSYGNGVLSASVNVNALPLLDTYLILWSGKIGSTDYQWRTEIELVGGYLFEVADLRAFDRQFNDTTKWPVDKLRRARTWVENTIEGRRAGNVAFVPRGRRAVLDGTGKMIITPDYQLRELYSATIDDVALTTEQVADVRTDDNIMWRSSGLLWPTGRRNVALHYEHGYDRPPGAITRAALLLAREYLIQSDLPGRATATSIGDQMFRLTIAGRDGVTGIPEVDAAIEQFGRKGFGIG